MAETMTADCAMPGCPREVEQFDTLCDLCAVAVADLADRIGDPDDLTRRG